MIYTHKYMQSRYIMYIHISALYICIIYIYIYIYISVTHINYIYIYIYYTYIYMLTCDLFILCDVVVVLGMGRIEVPGC